MERSDFSHWLATMISNRQSYHNHKEMMAWVITALYVPGVIYFGNSFQGDLVWQIMTSVGLFFVAYLIIVFVKMQFDRRWEAADIIEVLLKRWAEFNRSGELPRADEWIIDKEEYYWPYFVQTKKENLWSEKRNFPKFICNYFLISIPCIGLRNNGTVDPRWKTELPSYTLITAATIFTIFLLLKDCISLS